MIDLASIVRAEIINGNHLVISTTPEMSSDPLCTGTQTREAYQDIVMGCKYVLEYLVNSGHWTGTDLHEKVSKFVMAAYRGIYVHIKYSYGSQQETYVLMKTV